MVEKPAYITLKDCKENFNTNPQCRLINLAKCELWKVAKNNIEKINQTVREKLHCNQWINTLNVTDLLQNITDKGICIFSQFDIEEFYLSITKHLLRKATEHATFYTSTTHRNLTSSYTTENPYCFPKINLGRKQLMNHYLT